MEGPSSSKKRKNSELSDTEIEGLADINIDSEVSNKIKDVETRVCEGTYLSLEGKRFEFLKTMSVGYEELVIDDQRTGFCRCTDPDCHKVGKVNKKMLFKVHDKGQKYKRQYFKRHEKQHENRPQLAPNQSTITSFTKKKILTEKFIDEMRNESIKVICEKRLPLNHFEGEPMLNYTTKIFAYAGISSEEVTKIMPSARTVRRTIETNNISKKEIIKKYGPALAEKGNLSLMIDHQTIGDKTSDVSKSALGVLLTVTHKQIREHYLLSFHSTTDKTDQRTVEIVHEVLKVI